MFRSTGIVLLIAATGVASSALAQTAPAPAGEAATAVTNNAFNWQASTGIDYSVGKYGATSDTKVFDVPFDAQLQMDRLRGEAMIPYMDITGPGVSAGEAVVVKKSTTTVTERSGIGDLNLIGAWAIHREDTVFPGIEIAGTVKLPTAGSGLGTGKTDFQAQANLYHTLAPGFLIFGSLGYQWLGSSTTFPLQNGFRATAGLNYKPQDNIAAGLTLDYRESYESGLPDYAALDPYLAWRFTGNWGISLYGIIGLTNATPRFGTGFRVIFFS